MAVVEGVSSRRVMAVSKRAVSMCGSVDTMNSFNTGSPLGSFEWCILWVLYELPLKTAKLWLKNEVMAAVGSHCFTMVDLFLLLHSICAKTSQPALWCQVLVLL